jgi:hypothetical protein
VNTDHTAAEIILKLLAEGGSLTLLGIKAADGWRFKVATDEGTMFDLLSDEDRAGMTPSDFRSESAWVGSWQEALALLDAYRLWPQLSPRKIHPEFRRAIWAAVKKRTAPKQALWRRLVSRDRRTQWQLDQWRRACRGLPERHGRRTITFGEPRR